MVEKKDEVQYRNVRSFDAIDTNTLPDFRTRLISWLQNPRLMRARSSFAHRMLVQSESCFSVFGRNGSHET